MPRPVSPLLQEKSPSPWGTGAGSPQPDALPACLLQAGNALLEIEGEPHPVAGLVGK